MCLTALAARDGQEAVGCGREPFTDFTDLTRGKGRWNYQRKVRARGTQQVRTPRGSWSEGKQAYVRIIL